MFTSVGVVVMIFLVLTIAILVVQDVNDVERESRSATEKTTTRNAKKNSKSFTKKRGDYMNVLEELREIQAKAKIEEALKRADAQKKAQLEAEEKRKRDTEAADSDFPSKLEEIKKGAKEHPHANKTTLALGIVSRRYSARMVENLEEAGFTVVLSSRFHPACDYADEGYHDAYTTYTVEVSW